MHLQRQQSGVLYLSKDMIQPTYDIKNPVFTSGARQYKRYLHNILSTRIIYYLELKEKDVHKKLKEDEIRFLSYLKLKTTAINFRSLGFNTELELYYHILDVFNKKCEHMGNDYLTISHLLCSHSIPIMSIMSNIESPIKIGDIGYSFHGKFWILLCNKYEFNWGGYIVNSKTSYKVGQYILIHVSYISNYIDRKNCLKPFRRIKFN